MQLCPPRAPVAHWAMRAMNMQCLSPNTQVRWKQRPLEQLQLPGVGWGGMGWDGVGCVHKCSLSVLFQAWDLLTSWPPCP